MTNRILKHLETIIETGSVLAASRRLFVSQPALSQYIKRLENEYGITIFDRQTSPWSLTQEGQELLEAQKRIDEIDRECRQRFTDRRNLKIGEIRVASTAYRTATLLNPVLSHFKKENPEIVVRIVEGNTTEVLELVEAGHADCGVAISSLVPDTLDHIRIYSEEVLIGLPADHPYVRAHPKPLDRLDTLKLSKIKGTPFIIMKSGQVFHEYFYQLCRDNKIELPVTLETQSILTVPALISTGIGAALIPSTILEDCLKRNIAVYRPTPSFPPNNVSLAWKRNRYRSHATQKFIQRTLELLEPDNATEATVFSDGLIDQAAKT